MQLYEKIQFLRKTKNMTQTDLAVKLGVTRQSVQKWENGTSSPDISKLPELAFLFGVSVDILLNSKMTEEKIMKEIYEDTKPKQIETARYHRSILDYLLLLPIYVLIFCLIVIFYMIGSIVLVGVMLLPIFLLLICLYSIILAILNFASGIGMILLSIGTVLIGMGLFYPTCLLAIWFKQTYQHAVIKVTNRIKKIDIRKGLN